MITKDNYFKKLKFIKFGALPAKLQKGYSFVEKATEEYTHWDFYKDKDIKEKIEKYFSELNAFLSSEQENNFTESDAREVAKKLIRNYVLRGDRFEDLKGSLLGSRSDDYSAKIKNDKIAVEEIKRQKVEFSFSLAEIFNEVKKEQESNEHISQAKVQKQEQKKTKTPQPVEKTSGNNNKPIHISYENSKPVERITDEVKFIKRYLSLHNKQKTKLQILSFLNSLQKAILEKRIRKNSSHASEIMQIQRQLITAHRLMKNGDTLTIGADTIKKFSQIVGAMQIRLSTKYLKRYIGIQGKTLDKKKAENLLNAITAAFKSHKVDSSDPFADRVKRIMVALRNFIQMAKKDDTLELHHAALNGLDGILGCASEDDREISVNGITPDSPEVMTIAEARTKEYKLAKIEGKWKELIGEMCLPTNFFVYGPGGGGKTSFVLLFTQYLSSLGYKILYIAGEQFNTPPFTKLLNRLNIIAGENFKIVAKLDTLNMQDFDFVVLDSKDNLRVDLADFEKLIEEYPEQSFIVLPHSLKSGNFKGEEGWRNVVDVMIPVYNGIVETGNDKNRWGGLGQMLIYDHPSHYLERSA